MEEGGVKGGEDAIESTQKRGVGGGEETVKRNGGGGRYLGGSPSRCEELTQEATPGRAANKNRKNQRCRFSATLVRCVSKRAREREPAQLHFFRSARAPEIACKNMWCVRRRDDEREREVWEKDFEGAWVCRK